MDNADNENPAATPTSQVHGREDCDLLGSSPPAGTPAADKAYDEQAVSPQVQLASLDPEQVRDNRFWVLFFNAFRLRCPVCKMGKIFPTWMDVKKTCPACGVELEQGHGDFIGSIYFNYGATTVLTLGMYLIGKFVLDWPNLWLILGLAVFATVFPFYFLRYARASWLVFDQYFQPRVPPNWPA